MNNLRKLSRCDQFGSWVAWFTAAVAASWLPLVALGLSRGGLLITRREQPAGTFGPHFSQD